MNKPLTMVVKETKTKLVNVCNESGLPPVVLDLILQGIYTDVHSLVMNQAMEEEKIYIESIKNNGINNNDDVLGGANETE